MNANIGATITTIVSVFIIMFLFTWKRDGLKEAGQVLGLTLLGLLGIGIVMFLNIFFWEKIL